MKRHIITATLAAALAFSPMATLPARAADTEDVAKVVAGIAAIAIISEMVNRADKRSAATATSSRTSGATTYYNDRYREDTRWRGDDWRRDDWNRDRWHGGDNRNWKTVPQACLFTYETRRGPVRAYSEHCLDNRMRKANRLPAQCQDTIRTSRGPRDVYWPRCLREMGWTVEARYRGN